MIAIARPECDQVVLVQAAEACSDKGGAWGVREPPNVDWDATGPANPAWCIPICRSCIICTAVRSFHAGFELVSVHNLHLKQPLYMFLPQYIVY